MVKKWTLTKGRRENIVKAHKRLSTYVKLGKEAYEKRHKR